MIPSCMIPHAPRFGLLATLTAALLITAGALLPSAAASEPAPDISYVTVVVENDHTDPEDVVMDLKVTWEDAEGCEKDYNGYLLGWEQNIHIGAASAEERKITHSAAHDDLESGLGYAVKIYCGDQASMNLVSAVVIPETFIEGTPVPGTYSSRPALTQLSVSAGGLTPGFHRNRFDYQAPQAAEGVQRATIKTTIEEGASIVFIDGKTGPMGGMGQCNGYRCVFKYGDESGNSLEELEDADPEAPGFQVDLKHGAAYVAMHVHPPIQFGRIYQLTIGDPTAGALSNSPATGAPTISGTAEVGETLTADTSGIADTDGLDNVSFSYQWLSSRDTAISGATGPTYTLVSTDLGKTIKVKVTFTDDADNDESLTSAPTAAVVAANTPASGAPTITGTAQVGQTLTASTTGISDSDGLANATFAYQWLADDTEISGATVSTYTLIARDQGKAIKARVSFNDDRSNTERLTSVATGAVAARPTSPATGAPTITGTAQVGETLTASTTGISDADGLDNATFSYQWLADDTDIRGGTSSTYTLAAAEQAKAIKVTVSFSDDAGNQESVTSDPTEEVPGMWAGTVTVGNDPAGSGAVGYSAFATGMGSITAPDFVANGSGNRVDVVAYNHEGLHLALSRELSTAFTLHVDTKTFDSSSASTSEGSESYIYTWSQPGLNWAEGDSVLVIIVEDKASNTQGASTNSSATGTPTITGSVHVGETLTVDTSGIADEDGSDNANFAYQWVRLDGITESDIQGAAGSTYTLTSDDEGKTIKVQVTFTDDAGNAESLTSAATSAVAGVPEPVAPNSAEQEEEQQQENEPTPLTASYHKVPESHDGTSAFNFELRFSEAPSISYATLRDHAFTVTGGEVVKARRLEAGNNGRWEIIVEPSGSAEVTVSLPATTDCDGQGAICTGDGRKLSAEVEKSISGPSSQQSSQENHAATGAPAISGAAQVGEMLTADTSGIADEDGLDNATFTHQWLADETEISGATEPDYTLVSADEGKAIKVRVSFSDDADNEETLTSAATDVVTAKPNSPATGAPTVTGTAQVGETLTANTLGIADEDGLTSATFTYEWLADDAGISGATSSSYTLTSGEQGKAVKITVSFTDDAGNEETLTSAATAAVAARPNSAATGIPTITGTAQVGETLTAATSGIADADGLTNATFAYQWLAGESDISGAAGSSYTLTASEKSKTIEVRVTFTDDAGNDEALTSAATATVAARPNSPATGAPTISGPAQVAETLTADTSGIADADGLTNATFRFQWLADDTEISGATEPDYTLVSADEGKAVKVKVSFTDDAGNEEALTSAATAAVAPRPPLTASFLGTPTTHDGQTDFTFELRFSETPRDGFSYETLRDHSFTVTGGTVARARRLEPPGNVRWEITISPESNADVTVVLPITTDCDDRAAICTGDGRKLSNRLEFTVSGPGG